MFEPNLVFISLERLHILEDNIHGAPDLVVEVLLPGSAKKVNGIKSSLWKVQGKGILDRTSCYPESDWL